MVPLVKRAMLPSVRAVLSDRPASLDEIAVAVGANPLDVAPVLYLLAGLAAALLARPLVVVLVAPLMLIGWLCVRRARPLPTLLVGLLVAAAIAQTVVWTSSVAADAAALYAAAVRAGGLGGA